MLAILIYGAAMVAANLSVATFGPWVSPINSFLLIGLDLSLRDHLHDKWKDDRLWARMFALIVGAGLISWLLNPAAGKIAIASVVAFVAAGTADAVAYHFLRSRSYYQRTNGSNAVGAGVDSFLFPTIAFGGFLPHIVAMQFLAKFLGGAVWSVLIKKLRDQYSRA